MKWLYRLAPSVCFLLGFVVAPLLTQRVDAIVNNPTGYTLQFHGNGGGFSPADATTYYMGGLFVNNPLTTEGVSRIVVPKSGVVRRIDLRIVNTGTAGSAETSTVSFRLNATTDTTITSSFVTNAAGSFSNAALGITVAAGDFFEIKWVSPTWATNPTTVTIHGVVFVTVP